MYKKKNNKPMIIAVAAAVILIIVLVAVQSMTGKQNTADPAAETETEALIETETETPTHNILLYKTSSGSIEFDASWLVSDSDTESVLEVEESALVTMTITPADGKALESVDVLDYDMQSVSCVVRSVDGTSDSSGEMRLSFVMPDRDVFINFNFISTVVETEEETEATLTAAAAPYGLTLHGLTDEIKESYAGNFDEIKFLSALGEALKISSDDSEYRSVTDVYFGNQAGEDETASGTVAWYVYFNGYETWKVLSIYYISEDSFVFTGGSIEEETEALVETETDGNITIEGTGETEALETSSTALNLETVPSFESESTGTSSTASTGTYSGSGSSSNGGITSSSSTTSFDILSVSTVFLKFVGDEDAFYEAAFNYVLGKGYSGAITGTMSSYEIDADNQTATISIMLSSGGTMTGVYDKNANTYSFSGL